MAKDINLMINSIVLVGHYDVISYLVLSRILVHVRDFIHTVSIISSSLGLIMQKSINYLSLRIVDIIMSGVLEIQEVVIGDRPQGEE